MARTVPFEDCEVVNETELAICVDIPEFDEEIWIPKSVVDDDSEVWEGGQKGRLVVQEWFAKKESMI